ncbi:glycosyltransferase [Nocardia sp. SYP-A9097]|uniref:glycosyltransferase n=1 Tax=Nocardia sp. SYP-A9097 TaxID=2663237 RepID=UPI00129A7618|nr:glycosyltransferase [Nocardia sp. SYP-A9097]MRH88262.1 glycosyltransferase [Nocardia sp. SYP-A9097]
MSSAVRQPIRVLYVVPDLRVGGAERHVTTLLPNLDRGRFEPSVICIGEPGELFADLTVAGVPARALHYTKRQAGPALRDLVRAMRELRPDVVITRGYNAEALGRIAAWRAGVPNSIVWVHNYGDVEPRGRFRTVVDRVLDRRTSAYFGVARAQIRYMADDLGYPESKIKVIYNGVDPSAFEIADDRAAAADIGVGADDLVVGIIAALRPEKDHTTFLEAARIIAEKVPAAKFLIVGDGPMRGVIEDRIRASGLGDRVILAGNRPDIAALLRAMDVVVLSSYSVECFPMALLEAMAAARPAVCTAVGGVPEMIADGETGYLVPPRNPEELARRLIEVLSDAPARRRMGLAARDRVETKFTLKSSIAAAEQALEEVVNR